MSVTFGVFLCPEHCVSLSWGSLQMMSVLVIVEPTATSLH